MPHTLTSVCIEVIHIDMCIIAVYVSGTTLTYVCVFIEGTAHIDARDYSV